MHFILPGELHLMRLNGWQLKLMKHGKKMMPGLDRKASLRHALLPCFPTGVSTDSLKDKVNQTREKRMTTDPLPTCAIRERNWQIGSTLLPTGFYRKPWIIITWAVPAKASNRL